MSRWLTEFSGHPFQNGWVAFKDELNSTEIDDKTIQTSVEELGRLKKVAEYLDVLINHVDAELTPKSVWNNFQSQLDACLTQVKNYKSNRNIAHIVQANEHADNLLSYVKPYFVLPPDVISASKAALNAYGNHMSEYVKKFSERTRVLVDEIEDKKNQSDSFLGQTNEVKKAIEDFHNALLIGSPENEPISLKISKAEKDVAAQANAIDSLHSQLVVGEQSVKTVVAKAREEVEQHKNEVISFRHLVEEETEDLQAFHTKIFGTIDSSSGQKTGGLENELELRLAQLTEFENDQKAKHNSLFDKIESLLPGATSTGLASAYKEIKDSFTDKISLYTKFFYAALGVLVIAAMLMTLRKINIWPEFAVEFIEVPQWDYVLKALLYKVPFVAPAIWLAVFASTRRSQYERLQQEYAHKEALAKSYESYRKQLQDLNSDSEALQKELIAKAIDAIAYNASVTLDGKHEDKVPVHRLIEKFAKDDLERILSFVRAKSAEQAK